MKSLTKKSFSKNKRRNGQPGHPGEDKGTRQEKGISVIPFGFGQSPDFPPDEGPGLRRLEQHRALMESYGDSSPLWLTELGYARQTPGWDLGEHAIGEVRRQPPAPGQHSREILQEVGLGEDEIDALCDARIVLGPDAP